MATGVREVGVRLKVGAEGTDNLTRLGEALKTLGVDTGELDRKAEELSRQLVQTGDAGAEAAVDQEKLAQAAEEAGKAAQQLATAAQQAAGGTGELGTSSQDAKKQLSEMKLELAAAGATVYTIGRALGSAAKDAAGFESAMAEVATLVEDTSGLDEQANAVRRLAREYGGDAQGQAKALYQIISAGAEQGAEAIGILDTANRLAVGGVTDITTAADGLTSILNAYGDKAGGAARVSDQLFVAMKAGKTTVGELSSSIGQVAPIAAQAGVGLDELLGGISALTKGGVSTSQSVTQLRGIISSVIAPSAEATRVAQSLGLQFDAQALQAKGLAGFLEDVRAKTGGNTETMAKLFGQVEALGGVLALTGNQAGSFAQILQDMARSSGATDEAVAKITETSAFAAKQFQSALADVRISLGQAVTAFTPLLQVATDAINVFNELPQPVKVGVAGVVALGVAIGPLTLAIGSLTRAAGLASTALGLKAAAATTLAPAATAAAGATAAMGAAAAAATPALGGAATATTLLSRAMLALRAALPVGLILTVASLAAEFFRAKKEAEDADAAVRKMLETPVRPEVPRAAAAAADSLELVNSKVAEGEAELKKLADQALIGAKALGVDLARSAGRVSEEFATKLTRLDDIIKGLDALEKQGVQTGTLVEDALTKMIDSAKNSEEFDALRAKITQLGVEAKISEGKATELMEALERGAKKAVGELSEVDKALKAFGITGQQEARTLAENLGRAWQVIRNDATVSLRDKQEAFRKYAQAAIAANGGVADSTLKAQARALDLAIEFDKAGKAIVRAASDGKREVDNLRRATEEAGRAAVNMGQMWQQANAARNARVSANALPSDFQGVPGGTVRTGAGFNTPPPGNPADYVWMTSRERPGGFWQLTPAASERILNEDRARLGLPPLDPRTGLPVGQAAAPAGGFNGNAGFSPFGTAAPAPAAPSQVVEIRFPDPSGGSVSVAAQDRATADRLIRLLRDEFERLGSLP